MSTWKQVAETLASRLYWSDCTDHPASTPDLDGCPFCKDRAAYALYVAKVGRDPWVMPPSRSVSLDELRAAPETPQPIEGGEGE